MARGEWGFWIDGSGSEGPNAAGPGLLELAAAAVDIPGVHGMLPTDRAVGAGNVGVAGAKTDAVGELITFAGPTVAVAVTELAGVAVELVTEELGVGAAAWAEVGKINDADSNKLVA